LDESLSRSTQQVTYAPAAAPARLLFVYCMQEGPVLPHGSARPPDGQRPDVGLSTIILLA
jgi:hypothetical protein